MKEKTSKETGNAEEKQLDLVPMYVKVSPEVKQLVQEKARLERTTLAVWWRLSLEIAVRIRYAVCRPSKFKNKNHPGRHQVYVS